MAWKPYDENEYQKPSEINWLLWIAMFGLTYFITSLGDEHWPGGWDGNTPQFWDDAFLYSAGGLGLVFILYFISYYVLSIQYNEWEKTCRHLDMGWKEWGHRHFVCLASFSQFPAQVSPRNWVENRAQLEQYIQQTLPIESLGSDTKLESVFKTVLEPLASELNVIATHYPIRCHLVIQAREIENLESRFRTVLQQVIDVKTSSITIELHPVECGFKAFAPIFQHSLEEAHLFVIAQFDQPKQVSDALSSYLVILGEYHEQNPILPGKVKLYRPQLITQENTALEMDKFHTTLEKANSAMPLIQSASPTSHSHTIFTYLANANSSPTDVSDFSAYTGKLGVLGDFHALGFMAETAVQQPKQLLLANFSPENTYISYVEPIKSTQ